MTTYSLTTFNAELDLLELRLKILDPVVDVHVVAEAPVTHRGEPKPLHFAENRERFAQWDIRHIVVEDMPTGQREAGASDGLIRTHPGDSDHWEREQHQRSALIRGLGDVEDDDLILLSDLDEIPNREAFRVGHVYAEEGRIACPNLAMHVYRLHWRWAEAFPGVARFFSGRTLREHGNDLKAIRDTEELHYGSKQAPALGWHLAAMGGVEAVRRKLIDTSHHELDRDDFKDEGHIERCIDTGADIFNRPECQAERCPEAEMPPCVS